MTRLSNRIAKNLKAARKAADLTQQALANLAGVSVVHISRLERAQVEQPRRAELESVAAALGKSADDLMGLDDDEVKADVATMPIGATPNPTMLARDLAAMVASDLAELLLELGDIPPDGWRETIEAWRQQPSFRRQLSES